MSVIKVDKHNFEREVLNSKIPVLLDFWEAWCGPCRNVAPVLDEIARERKDIKVCKINVDEERVLSGEFGIISIPTLMVMEEGKVVRRSSGARPKAQILAML